VRCGGGAFEGGWASGVCLIWGAGSVAGVLGGADCPDLDRKPEKQPFPHQRSDPSLSFQSNRLGIEVCSHR
jgi:hypothetical protein